MLSMPSSNNKLAILLNSLLRCFVTYVTKLRILFALESKGHEIYNWLVVIFIMILIKYIFQSVAVAVAVQPSAPFILNIALPTRRGC